MSDERDLIRRSRQGDETAFEQLVLLKRDRAFRIARHMVGNDAEAQDIAQQAFIRLWSALPNYDQSAPFDPWFFTIVINLAIDHSRRARRSPLVALPDEADQQMGASPSMEVPGAEARLMTDELRRIFDTISGELAPAQRAVFTLRAIEGMPTEEVARIMEIRPSTVRNHLHQARRVLQGALRRRFPEYARGRRKP
ncbi:MAG: RNA polymerase sigma factor [Candidatus Polarisedimenticolia bacterium]